ncbi:MAG: Gfo/Idh/MocA family oxidoreductase [Kiritimatiellia bacterium]
MRCRREFPAQVAANIPAPSPAATTARLAQHADKFDAVIVSVPDHLHAPILLTAMAHDKHVYGQKPLVHQLEELAMVERAQGQAPPGHPA